SQRWAEARLAQLLDEGAGRAALVDLGIRHHVVTPYTSFYVPTKNEMTPDERAELARAQTEALASASWRPKHETPKPEALDQTADVTVATEGRAQREIADKPRRLEDQRIHLQAQIEGAKSAPERVAQQSSPVTVAAPRAAAPGPMAGGGAKPSVASKAAA